MFSLPPPRHISTLPIPTENQPSSTGRLLGANQKWLTYSQIDADDPKLASAVS
jgi:hypothetical protein